MSEYSKYTSPDLLYCAVRGAEKGGGLPIQVTVPNTHPARCALLCRSPQIQPLTSAVLSHLRVETSPANDAFTSFAGFYPERRQSGRISPASIRATFLCQLSALSLWRVWQGKLLDEI